MSLSHAAEIGAQSYRGPSGHAMGDEVNVGIVEHEVEWAGKLLDEVVGVSQSRFDVGLHPGLLEVLQRRPVPAGIDLDGDDLAARLGRGPREPGR